ncbi:hypothetical protein F4778DRAFT_545273 [Xylariomycetidae sp. FL2044]|nr:hypothetical protein F4778DRAFT_545273 [Xylariomycetidae sp. FL2044]
MRRPRPLLFYLALLGYCYPCAIQLRKTIVKNTRSIYRTAIDIKSRDTCAKRLFFWLCIVSLRHVPSPRLWYHHMSLSSKLNSKLNETSIGILVTTYAVRRSLIQRATCETRSTASASSSPDGSHSMALGSRSLYFHII